MAAAAAAKISGNGGNISGAGESYQKAAAKYGGSGETLWHGGINKLAAA